MMAHARSTGTHRPTLVVPIDIDKEYRSIESLLDEELTEPSYLLLGQGLLGMSIGTHRAIDVVPQIGCTLLGSTLYVLTVHQLIVVVLADAGCYAENESCLPASTDTTERALIHLIALSPTVALFLQSLDADKRCHISCLAELKGNILCEKRPIGEKLEVAIVVSLEDADKPIIHQGLTTQYAKEFGTVAFAFADDAVYLLHRQSLPSSLAYPAAATSQIAGLGDGNHVEGREEWFPPLLSPFKLPHIP